MPRTGSISATCLTFLLCAHACGCGGAGDRPHLASYDPVGAPGEQTASASLPSVSEAGAPAPRSTLVTAEGVIVHYPVWLELHPQQKAEMLAELLSVVPEPDPRISADARGVPPGTTLTVLDPGPYYAPQSPTGLASGEWRGGASIAVAWRGTSSGRLLPALPHELRHLLTADPLAGH